MYALYTEHIFFVYIKNSKRTNLSRLCPLYSTHIFNWAFFWYLAAWMRNKYVNLAVQGHGENKYYKIVHVFIRISKRKRSSNGRVKWTCQRGLLWNLTLLHLNSSCHLHPYYFLYWAIIFFRWKRLIKFNILDIAYGFQLIVTSTNLGTVE
jgi:hypothetical protein